MSAFSMFAIAVALAMDAFAVAIVTGLTLSALTNRHLFRLSFHFGLFQAGMFAAGWYFGRAIQSLVAASDHWIAFILLLLVGANIIRNSFAGKEQRSRSATDPTSGWQLVMLSFATSIDALAVGLSLALIGTSITAAALAIGLTAAAFTVTGMMLGRRIGQMWGRRVELLGGVILIAIGLKIVWDHVLA
ncbi:MAG: manganese efflux pump MntP family protein [Terriglobales bacterium]